MGTKGAGGAGVLQTSGNAIDTPFESSLTIDSLFTPTLPISGRLSRRSPCARRDADHPHRRWLAHRRERAPEQEELARVGVDDDGVELRLERLILAARMHHV